MNQQEATEEPRSYPLVLRTSQYRGVQPVTGLVLAVLSFLIVAPLLGEAVAAGLVAIDHQGSFSKALEHTIALKPVTWQGLLYLNLLLAWLVLVTWAIVSYVHGVSPKWLMSVRPGVRLRYLGICALLAPVAVGVQLLVGALLPGDPNGLDGTPNKVTSSLVAMALVVLLTTPFQAMGEEYFFRGYLIQAFGALSRRPWVAIVVAALPFALAHGYQNLPLFLDRYSFGLIAGYLVLRTGGLEAGIALHAWNNIFSFGLALGLGDITSNVHVSDSSWVALGLSLLQRAVFVVLALQAADRMGITSTTERPVLLPTTTPV